MYIDRFLDYYQEIIYMMEQSGTIKEGSYSKMTTDDKTEIEKIRNLLKTM